MCTMPCRLFSCESMHVIMNRGPPHNRSFVNQARFEVALTESPCFREPLASLLRSRNPLLASWLSRKTNDWLFPQTKVFKRKFTCPLRSKGSRAWAHGSC